MGKWMLLALWLLAMSACAGGEMGAYRLQRDSESLVSFAAEGRMLAQAAADGGAPSQYVATHASELGADCGDLASVVSSTTPVDGSARPRQTLALLATRATTLFEQLEQAPNDEPGARRIAGQFAVIADRASKLEEQA